jgi:thiol-disulfide isomerase/thioredoxin
MNKNNVLQLPIMFTLLITFACSSSKEKLEGTIALENIELSTLSGEKINLADYRGRTVFINFWATWCRPCIQEMPSIASLQKSLAGENIEFLFASDEEVEKILKFKASRSMDLNFVRVENPEALGIQALPTTFIFNQNGKHVFSEVGFRKWDDPTSLELVTRLIK